MTETRSSIHPGSKVKVHDALGRDLPAVATSSVTEGNTFPIVWAALEGHPASEAVPWPAEDVEPAE